jgi:hypothetical protein
MKRLLILLTLLCHLSGNSQNLVSGEYFIDTAPAHGNGTPFSFTSSENVNHNLSIPLTSISPGFHHLFIRVKNSDNVWSHYEGRLFYIIPPVSSTTITDLVAGEYFIDTDPGIGNGNAINFGTTANLSTAINVDLTSISAGFHHLFIRVKNADGKWSHHEGRLFYVMPPGNNPELPQIVSGEWFVDTDPGIGNGTPISFAQGDSVNTAISINAENFGIGSHNLFIRVKNLAGKWSFYESVAFSIEAASYAEITSFVRTDSSSVCPRERVNLDYTVQGVFNNDNKFIVEYLALDGVSWISGAEVKSTISGTISFGLPADIPAGNNLPIRLISTSPFIASNDTIIIKMKGVLPTDFVEVLLDSTFTGNICNGTNLSFSSGTSNNATYYNWVLPNNITFVSGQGTNNVVVASNSNFVSGNIFVKPDNQCGSINRHLERIAIVSPENLKNLYPIGMNTGTGINMGASYESAVTGDIVHIQDNSGSYLGCSEFPAGSMIGKIALIDRGSCYFSLKAYHAQKAGAIGVIMANNAPGIINIGEGAFGQEITIPVGIIDSTDANSIKNTLQNAAVKVLFKPYSLKLNGFNATTSTITESACSSFSLNGITYTLSGTYTQTLVNSMGCDSIITLNLTISPANNNIKLFTSLFNSTCSTCADGSVNLTATGGNGNVNFQWSTNDTTANLSGLLPGVYTVVATDINGCQATTTVNVTSQCDLALAMSSTNPVCFEGCNGAAMVNISGGTAPFNIRWNNGRTDAALTGLCAGNYSVIVTDASGCSATGAVVISDPLPINITTSVTASTCSKSTGSATATASGGSAPYIYQWSSGSKINVADSLAAGIYTVTVTDNKLCRNVATVTISDANAPNVTTTSVTDVNCFGGNNGAINITVSGGASPYKFLWSTGHVTEDVANLVAGPYEVRVMGADSCIAMRSINIVQPSKIEVAITSTEASCGGSDAVANAVVNGGNSPYNLTWSSGTVGSNTAVNLSAGKYNLNIMDNKGCVAVQDFAISEDNGPDVEIVAITPATCIGGDGAIKIEVTGGAAGGYNFLWSNGSSSQNISGLNSGNYAVTVSDINGCKGLANITVPYAAPPVQEICLVTVDTATSTNMVVWEKAADLGIASFNIYRESSQANVYFKIGNVAFDELSQFTDSVANPMIRSWKYKMSSVDACGNESAHSPRHKTLHLTINKGLGTSINLIWSHHEGFQIPSYYIYRWVGNEEQLIDSISSEDNTYTDLNPPEGDVFYQIEVRHPFGCEATRAVNHNSSRSNRSIKAPTGEEDEDDDISVQKIDAGISKLFVYPNPARDNINLIIETEGNQNLSIELIDMQGKKIYSENIASSGLVNRSLNTSAYSAGIYHLRIITSRGVMNKKVILNK